MISRMVEQYVQEPEMTQKGAEIVGGAWCHNYFHKTCVFLAQ